LSEHTEQVALFDWARANESRHLQLGLMFAIPNGGKRHIVTATRLKASGAKAGIPDISLPVSNRHGKHGLFIELKVGKNKPSKKQLWWIHSLRAEGYAVEVCVGFEEARDAIIDYLEIETE
jgi:hypothetical protein